MPPTLKWCLRALVLLSLAALCPAADQKYSGAFDRIEVYLSQNTYCDYGGPNKGMGSVTVPQSGSTPDLKLDSSKMTCPWGGISNISPSYTIPTAVSGLTDDRATQDLNRPRLDSSMSAAVSMAGTGSATTAIRSSATVGAAAWVCTSSDCGRPQDDIKQFAPPGSATAQKSGSATVASLTTDPKSIVRSGSTWTEFVSYFDLSSSVSFMVRNSGAFGDEMQIYLGVTVRVFYRFKLSQGPVLEVVGMPSGGRTFDKPSGPQTDTLKIRNTGGGTMDWKVETSTSSGEPWLTASPLSGTLGVYPPNEATVTYRVDPTGLSGGAYSGKIVISAANAAGSPKQMTVSMILEDGDQISLANPSPPTTDSLAAGSDVTLRADVQYKVQSKPNADLLLRVYDQTGALLNGADTPAAVSGSGTRNLQTAVRLGPTVTQAEMKAVLLSGGSLLKESASITWKAGLADAVTLLTAGMTPDPSQPVPWADRLRIVATVRVALGTRDNAEVVIRGTDQGGSDLAGCASNTGSGRRGQWDVTLVIDDCWLKKDTRQVILKAHLAPPGGGAALKISVPVTLNLDVPQNTVKLAIGRMKGGVFQEIPYSLSRAVVGTGTASSQLREVYARVEYNLLGDDGSVDILVDADVAGRGTWSGTLVSGVKAIAGSKREVFVRLPDWVVIPREHNYWILRARLNPKGDPPVRSNDADSQTLGIESIRILSGFFPPLTMELYDTDQSFKFPLEIGFTREIKGRLKAQLYFWNYQDDPEDFVPQKEVDLGDFDPFLASRLKTTDFSAYIPEDAGDVYLRFVVTGLPGGPMNVVEELTSEDVVYDTRIKPGTVGSGTSCCKWAQVDFQPGSSAPPRTIKPQVKPTTLGSIYDQVAAATVGVKALLPPRSSLIDPAREFLGINKVWQFGDPIPSDGSFVNDVTFRYNVKDLPKDPEFREDKLQVVSWDPAAAKLVFYTTTVDTAAHSATARLDGLAPYYSLAMQGPFNGGVLNLPLTGSGYQAAVSLINTGAREVAVSATAYTPRGEPFTSGVNPYTGPVPAGRAVTGTFGQIFQEGLAGDGWLQTRSDRRSLAGGVLLVSGAEMDTAGAAPPLSSVLVFGNVSHDAGGTTNLHLVNPGPFPARLTLELRSADGKTADTARMVLRGNGKLNLGLAGLFPSLPATFTGYVVARGDHELAGTALITSGSSLAVLAAQPSGNGKLYAAHVEAGKGSLKTRLNLVNTTSNTADVKLTLIGPDGGAGRGAALRLDPGARIDRELAQIFDPQGDVITGSLVIDAAPGVVGDIGFSDDAGKARALLPLSGSAAGQGFIQLTSAGGSFTGFAVFNPGSSPAAVTVKTYGLDGSLTGSARIQLGARGRHSGLVSKAVSGTLPDAGYFTIASDQPVVAAAVLGTTNQQALAALDPQPMQADSSGSPAAVQPVSNMLTGAPGPVAATRSPAIELSPVSLDFGPVAVGQTRELSLLVRNTGGDNLVVSGASIANPGFTVSSPGVPFVVPPGGAQAITVRFAPTSTGAQSATLQIASNDPSRATVSVTLAGSGTGGGGGANGPSIRVSPDVLDFGTVTVGQSKDLTVSLRNAGDAPLNVTSITSTDSQFTVVGSALTLDAGASRDVRVTFAPKAAGAQFGNLSIQSNDRANPIYIIALTGKGDGSSPPPSNVTISIAPSRLDFGDVSVGQTRDLTLTITGSTALSVTAVASDNPRFQVVNRPVPFGIGFGGSTVVTVRFTPDAAGSQSGAISFTSNATNQPVTRIPVTGAAVTAGPQTVVLAVDDGTYEAVASAPTGWDGYYMNRLTPARYPATLKAVRIYFRDQPKALEQDTDIAVFWTSKPPGRDDIDGLLWKRAMAKVKKPGEFNEYTVPDLTITEGDFVVGFTVKNPENVYPMAVDMSPGKGRSFFSTNGQEFTRTDDGPQHGGNYPIRAVVVVGGP